MGEVGPSGSLTAILGVLTVLDVEVFLHLLLLLPLPLILQGLTAFWVERWSDGVL